MDIRSYEAQVRLRDGTPGRIRAIRPSDKDGLRWGFSQLSAEAIYHRFFQSKRELSDPELAYLTEVDFADHVALVLELEVDGVMRIVGVGRLVRLQGPSRANRAEVAFTVGDEFQGRGVGTQLLDHLARLGPGLGITQFEAEVLADNRQMLEVFEHSGLAVSERVREGLIHVELGLGGRPGLETGGGGGGG